MTGAVTADTKSTCSHVVLVPIFSLNLQWAQHRLIVGRALSLWSCDVYAIIHEILVMDQEFIIIASIAAGRDIKLF